MLSIFVYDVSHGHKNQIGQLRRDGKVSRFNALRRSAIRLHGASCSNEGYSSRANKPGELGLLGHAPGLWVHFADVGPVVYAHACRYEYLHVGMGVQSGGFGPSVAAVSVACMALCGLHHYRYATSIIVGNIDRSILSSRRGSRGFRGCSRVFIGLQ